MFENLEIIEPILKALKEEGYTSPTPIQIESIPILLSGKDLLGSAQTGTGKTAAFAVPILQNIIKEQAFETGQRIIKALILAPTRELAAQIGESFKTYSKYLNIKTTIIFGGVSQVSQVNSLKLGVDILVATPGRLLDLLDQKLINISNIKYFVLDEADQMLDMGFINDVKKIIAKIPSKRQTMLFSATMPNEIIQLSKTILNNPIRIAITPVEATVDKIKQSIYYVSKKDKIKLLVDLLKNKQIISALVFSRTKHGANKIVKELMIAGINSEAIHGNKSQTARQNTLQAFKSKVLKVLIATDIAARGIDIDELSHVINYDLPEVPETYIHRIGRTGRAGLEGNAISFCSEEEVDLLKAIEKHIGSKISLVVNHPYAINLPERSIIKPKPIITHNKSVKLKPRVTSNPVSTSRTKKQYNQKTRKSI